MDQKKLYFKGECKVFFLCYENRKCVSVKCRVEAANVTGEHDKKI